MATEKKLTPMMEQFFKFKSQYPDALLLFRCGDFYETYCDDAIEAARILGITLTRRNNGATQGDAMAGFPYHALDTYMPKLIRAGRRVAICDQLEDPKKTKTLVKRGVTELVTPGIAMQDNVLSAKRNNFLASISMGKKSVGLALLDLSTGEFLCGEGNYDYVQKMIDNFQPKEVIYDRTRRQEFMKHFGTKLCVYEMDDWAFNLQTSRQKLTRHFKVKNLKGFGVDHLGEAVTAAGAVMQYLEMTQHHRIDHIKILSRLEHDRYVRLDRFTIRSLELLDTMNDRGTGEDYSDEGRSLLSVIDRTQTPMGGRLLRRWMVFPLKDVDDIKRRQNVTEYFFRDPQMRSIINEELSQIGDLERIASRISSRRVSPRELLTLLTALDSIEVIKEQCLSADEGDLNSMGRQLDACIEIRERIRKEIRPDCPLLVQKGGVIRRGVNEELDELYMIRENGKDYLLQIQQQEAERTGIQSLKIGFNNVFGYYLEVRNTYKDLVPQEWVRKQTLAQAERYITDELKKLEDKILGAEEKILVLEQLIFDRLVNDIAEMIGIIQDDARIIATLDCLMSFALIALENKYVRPVVDDSLEIDIHGGRHPVIETQMPVGEEYIPNDVRISSEISNSQSISSPRGGREGVPQIIIITGPNMAGKSALLRQTALIVLLAQIGSFVPAESAKIGVVDKIFTRVGASDNISQGESTFMVEMTEASNILNNVSDRSLVLFDELGRGTSTYDGISIAWAIVEYLHEQEGCNARTLFATHYHELNEMAEHFHRIKNYNVSVKEIDGRVIFLRKLVEGGSEHSFGIHVADIAGMPKSIVERAEVILRKLEAETTDVGHDVARKRLGEEGEQRAQGAGQSLSFFQLDDPILSQIRDEIVGLDVDNLTPLQALNKLNEIKKILKG